MRASDSCKLQTAYLKAPVLLQHSGTPSYLWNFPEEHSGVHLLSHGLYLRIRAATKLLVVGVYALSTKLEKVAFSHFLFYLLLKSHSVTLFPLPSELMLWAAGISWQHGRKHFFLRASVSNGNHILLLPPPGICPQEARHFYLNPLPYRTSCLVLELERTRRHPSHPAL